MASELVERTYRAYDAMSRDDVDTLIELCDPEVEFTSLIRESEGTVYRGHEGLREYVESLADVLPDWTANVESVEEHGDLMLVKARIYATPAGGDVQVEQEMWQVIRFRDLRALRWDFFRTEQEARAALLLSPPKGRTSISRGYNPVIWTFTCGHWRRRRQTWSRHGS